MIQIALLSAAAVACISACVALVLRGEHWNRVGAVTAAGAAAILALDWADGRILLIRAGVFVLVGFWACLALRWNLLVRVLGRSPRTIVEQSVHVAYGPLLLLSVWLLIVIGLRHLHRSTSFGGGWPFLLVLWLAWMGGALVMFWMTRRLRPGVAAVWIRLPIVIGAVVFALLALELVWKAKGNFGRNGLEVYQPGSGLLPSADGRFVYRGNFGSLREFEVPVKLNSLGYNDDEHAVGKPDGVARVVLLGDSYVEALQVPRDASVARQLEARLRLRIQEVPGRTGVECIAFGRSGAGQVQSRKILEELGMEYSPDLVVVEFLATNDLYDNDSELSSQCRTEVGYRLHRGMLRRFSVSRQLNGLAAVIFNLDRRLASLRTKGLLVSDQVYHELPLSDAWRRARKTTESAIVDMDAMVRAAGARMLVVVFTSPPEIRAFAEPGWGSDRLAQRAARAGLPTDGWDYRAPSEWMESLCEGHQIPIFNLNRSFAGLAPSQYQRVHFPHDGHWNELGHQLAAEAIDRFIAERELLTGVLGPGHGSLATLAESF